MIDRVALLLSRLFRWRVQQLALESQVRFVPPDGDWRTAVANLNRNVLNVYLVDIRENRALRTNETEKSHSGGGIFHKRARMRVDCHYLVSAWSPILATPQIDPIEDEHALLAEAAFALREANELDADQLYAATTASMPALSPPAVLKGEKFPIVLLPPEGFPKLAEFWGTMGDGHRWKPCIYLIVTVPLKEEVPARVGPMVTTITANMMLRDEPQSANAFLHIGGIVRAPLPAGGPPVPVPMAWVQLYDNQGRRLQIVRTDIDGRYVFVQVVPGSYEFRVTAEGRAARTFPQMLVPSPSGSYDLIF